MEKLKTKISQYRKWNPLDDYVLRIEAYIDKDFSESIGNAKALLESIGKEICDAKGYELKDNSSINAVLKGAFNAIGYSKNDYITQICSSIANIGQNIGELRNNIGSSAHGKTLRQLKERNDGFDVLTKDFLINSTELISCLLISVYEEEHRSGNKDCEVKYDDCEDFNDFFDDLYGEFSFGDYSFTASEVLYNNDKEAYITERKAFLEESNIE